MGVIAKDLTAIVPTFDRPDLLQRTISALLEGTVVPVRILVSEGHTDQQVRSKTTNIIADFNAASPVAVEMTTQPANGDRCGNQNHLVSFVDTPLILMLHDDCSVGPEFAQASTALLRTGQVDVVTSGDFQLWYTFRCHWRPRRPGDALAISLRCVAGLTSVFKAHPVDERIKYGSEELDFTLSIGMARVVFCDKAMTHNARESARYELPELRQLSLDSRVLVGIRRYWDSRPRLALFLLTELAYCAMGRQPSPKQVIPGQWVKAVQHLVGCEVARP